MITEKFMKTQNCFRNYCQIPSHHVNATMHNCDAASCKEGGLCIWWQFWVKQFANAKCHWQNSCIHTISKASTKSLEYFRNHTFLELSVLYVAFQSCFVLQCNILYPYDWCNIWAVGFNSINYSYVVHCQTCLFCLSQLWHIPSWPHHLLKAISEV